MLVVGLEIADSGRESSGVPPTIPSLILSQLSP